MDKPFKGTSNIRQGETLIRASKWFPFGGLLFGLVFCGTAALFVGKWWPTVWYFVPWVIHAGAHYLNQDRFLSEAAWCMKIKVAGQVIVFVHSPSLAVYSILIDWYGFYHSIATSLIYTALIYGYFQIYLGRTRTAWEEKRTSNHRFAIDPNTQTFRFDQGFNFGSIPGMWWDNLIFGALFTLTTFSGALIGGLAVEVGAGTSLVLVASALLSFLSIRWLITREVVTLQKIQEYEEEHGVTIRPR